MEHTLGFRPQVRFCLLPRLDVSGYLDPGSEKLPNIWRFLNTASARSCHFGGLLESKLISVQLFIVTGSVPEET